MTDRVDEYRNPDGAVQFGPYRIHELIGAGGMAEVYRASRADADSAVVIKRVKPKHASDPGFVRMFEDEAKLTSRLRHPNIVEVYEFGEIEDHHYIAMEYIDGLHLQAAHVRHVQVKGKPLSWRVAVIVVRDMLRGLHYAHGKQDEDGRPLGLVHRDINLVNIMLGRDGAVKVLDFGIVKAADGIRSAETVGGVLKGKFGYMSPEQAEGRSLDPRSDVFSAAIVLHELLTGRRLFWGEDDLAILRKVRDGEIPDPRTYQEGVPEVVAKITLKGLSRKLEGRYGSAEEMADALDGVVKELSLSDAVVREVMAELLPPRDDEAAAAMRSRRRKMTLLAWKAGVTEKEPDAGRQAAGVLGEEKHQPTALAKRKTLLLDESGTPLEEAELIATDARWLMPEGEATEVDAVLGEQDFTSVAAARIGDGTADEATLILVGSTADEQITDAEQALFAAAESAPSLADADAETRILDDSDDTPAQLSTDSPPKRTSRTLKIVIAILAALVVIVLLYLKLS